MAEESGGIFGTLGLKEERITRLFPLGLGAAYFVGFVVVGLQLAGYGASPLELFKIQYLAAGLWFGLIAILYHLTAASARLFYRERLPESWHNARRKRYIKILCSAIVVGAVVGGSYIPATVVRKALFLPLSRESHIAELVRWQGLLAPTVFFLGLLDITSQVYFLAREAPRKPGKLQVWKFFVTLIAASIFVLALFSCVESFARNVYPNIPFSLGGGQPRQVIFWLDASTAAGSFLKRDGSQPYTIHYELLVENENSLVVISPNDGERAIEFDRKSVGAVVVLGKRTGPAHFERNVNENAPPP